MTAQTVRCPYCGQPAPLVSGLAVYPHLRRLWARKYYLCAPCGAWVGCHPPASSEGGGQGDGTVPMGRLANAQLREARQAAHAVFDPIWKTRRMTRRQSYEWLAKRLGMPPDACHIGEFDVDQCRKVLEVVALFREKEATRGQRKTQAGKPVRPSA